MVWCTTPSSSSSRRCALRSAEALRPRGFANACFFATLALVQPPFPPPPPSPHGPGPSPQQGVPRPPPGSGGLANNKMMVGAVAGCGCLGLLMVAGVMITMVLMRRPTAQDPSLTTGPGGAPLAGTTPPAPPPTAPGTTAPAGDTQQVAAQYLIALGESTLAAARGEYGDERFGSPHGSAIPNVVALGAAPAVQLVVVRLGGSAGSQHVRTSLVAFPDGRLRAAEAKLGGRPSGVAFEAGVGPELFALITSIGDGLLQRGQCPTLLAMPELTGLPQPLIADLTRELGESRSECQGLRPWPGFQDAWSPRVDGMLVIAEGPSGPVLVEADLRPVRGILTPSHIREPRAR